MKKLRNYSNGIFITKSDREIITIFFMFQCMVISLLLSIFHLWCRFDSDESGKISIDEFLEHLRVNRAFGFIDKHKFN